MISQACAICEKNNFSVVYPENFEIDQINSRIFSARRLPDRIHYRMVRCKTCGLLYSTPILEYDKIAKLYLKSFITYDEHQENLKETYGYYLKELEQVVDGGRVRVEKTRSLLEIGCGNGFFLEEAAKQGYDVYGVEPGAKSVAKAKTKIRKKIVVDLFRPEAFKKNFFDVICCFQTFDHIPNPNKFLEDCRQILKKGGLMLFLNHDEGAWTNRLMGERSPIIDIEHTYLFNKKTMRKIFEKHEFAVLEIKSSFNIHHLSYWIHLFPLPKSLKLSLIKVLDTIGLGKIKIKLNPGNLVLYAQK